jgi:hypothetical protein
LEFSLDFIIDLPGKNRETLGEIQEGLGEIFKGELIRVKGSATESGQSGYRIKVECKDQNSVKISQDKSVIMELKDCSKGS